LPQVCGQCGDDISLRVHKKFSDMLMEKPHEPRGSHYSKGMSVEAATQLPTEVAYYKNDVFDLGSYIHELFAIEIPDYPECRINDCPKLQEIKKKISDLNSESVDFHEKQGHPGFTSLKNIKLN
jgi:uncharacterized metal-binding protein YceD (DUF177 family)